MRDRASALRTGLLFERCVYDESKSFMLQGGAALRRLGKARAIANPLAKNSVTRRIEQTCQKAVTTMSVLEQVIEVVADTLNLPAETLHESSSAENLPAWDSLAHVNLMIALEQTFDIQLEVEDFPKLNSIAAIQAYLVNHGAS